MRWNTPSSFLASAGEEASLKKQGELSSFVPFASIAPKSVPGEAGVLRTFALTVNYFPDKRVAVENFQNGIILPDIFLKAN